MWVGCAGGRVEMGGDVGGNVLGDGSGTAWYDGRWYEIG